MEFPTQRDSPLRLQKMYKINLSAARNFSILPPTAQHQKSKKYKKTQKKLFQCRWIPVKYFFRQKMQISSNLHFFRSDQKTQFFNWHSFQIPGSGQNYPCTQKPVFKRKIKFLIQFLDNILMPIQFPDNILIPHFRIFIHAISNSLITIIKFSFKNHTQKI